MSAGQLVPVLAGPPNATVGGGGGAGGGVGPGIEPKFDPCYHQDRHSHIDLVIAVPCAMYLLFGTIYFLFGYRCFKAVMFLTGFVFGSGIVYLICIQDKMMPPYCNVGVALSAGLLLGLITMLVQYVGLFMTGFHTGLLLGIAALAFSEPYYKPPTLLAVIGSLLGSGLLFAILNLQFQKVLTIIGTCVYGGAIVSGVMDYFVENLAMVGWLWGRVVQRRSSAASSVASASSASAASEPCWFGWLILGFWPALVMLGLVVQCSITGRGIHHQQLVHVKRHHHTNPNRVRVRTREQRAELRQKKYRYLYQIRTAHGDVISQNYVQALQRKVISGPGGNGCNGGESSTLQSDATHLTILPGEHHPNSNMPYPHDDDIHYR
ncbi:transmembrane protein 198 [Nilaparvata lugens]|uniref:transmembrane protein 198 n=1 Tax=Nilaparvata lugens TaxID=108931 RepID=UPI00193D3580|nr:transmembrane protein 198 [Nilaparvata lugens]XP_039280805.1 transmembrane protein 198 [Nilaparvata lugens]